MKKFFALTILLTLFCVPAFALEVVSGVEDNGQTVQGSDPATIDIGKCSKGVRIAFTYETTAYAIQTLHKSGSKYYGTAYDSTAIYSLTPAGDINLTFEAPATSVSATAFTGWTTL